MICLYIHIYVCIHVYCRYASLYIQIQRVTCMRHGITCVYRYLHYGSHTHTSKFKQIILIILRRPMTFGMMPRLPWGSPMDMFLASCLSGTFGPRIVHCSFLTGTLGMGRGGHGSGQRLSPSFDLRKLLGGLPVSVFEGLEIMVNPFPHRNHQHPPTSTNIHASIHRSIHSRCDHAHFPRISREHYPASLILDIF
jgi:hypothetical protein